ncbi:ParB/RepB/Spo0J family partition protein [Salmonella enterica]|nr:ParB/RepB/Spo0J family partition protein [Salmonella enterica]EBU2057121.1 ParB/RepB/Spo0J family partition protein [Salmonella enterica]
MSVTESKTKTERKSSRKPAKTQETVLSALLAQTEEVSVPLASLIKSPLNVRTVPYSAESVSELAESIKGVGLLQNLVVHTLPGDRYGVAAGGRRLAALNMLAERNILPADWPVRVKVIPQELATAASMTENGHRRDMHPAEQIAGFRAMAQEGKTSAQIGDLLGYSPRHVQRMLKLADLAPVILDALAEDRITTEHCQALALENAIGFHMRDWWQPTKANFFGHLKKPQIIAALNDAGLSGAARDAEKMKKGDAAEHAEHHMKDNRWVPGWMCAPHPQTDATERTDNLADAA